MLHKKGQISDTLTWIVATIVIVVVLVVSVFAASGIGGAKGVINRGEITFDLQTDLLAAKSLNAYVLTEGQGGESVYEQFNKEEDFNGFTGSLGVKIFEEFYEGRDYSDVWLGVVSQDFSLLNSNSYFGIGPSVPPIDSRELRTRDVVSELIKLKGGDWLELILAK